MSFMISLHDVNTSLFQADIYTRRLAECSVDQSFVVRLAATKLFVHCEALDDFLHLPIPVRRDAEPDADRGSVHQRRGETVPEAWEIQVFLEGEP